MRSLLDPLLRSFSHSHHSHSYHLSRYSFRDDRFDALRLSSLLRLPSFGVDDIIADLSQRRHFRFRLSRLSSAFRSPHFRHRFRRLDDFRFMAGVASANRRIVAADLPPRHDGGDDRRLGGGRVLRLGRRLLVTTGLASFHRRILSVVVRQFAKG